MARDRDGYLVPASAVMAAIGGEFVALLVIIYGPQTWPWPGAGTFGWWPPGIPLDFLALYLGTPLAMSVAAVIAYVGTRMDFPLGGTGLGIVLGLVVAGLVALQSAQIAWWWLDSLGSDSVAAALLFGFLAAILTAISAGLSGDAVLLGWAPANRPRLVGAILLAVLLGTVVGGLAGTSASALTLANHSCPPGPPYPGPGGPCLGPSSAGYVALGRPGFLVGSFGGAVGGLTAGLIVGAVTRVFDRVSKRPE